MLLDNTQLGPNLVHVSSAASLDDMSSPKTDTAQPGTAAGAEDVAQEDKPRARVLAEYIAHGYTVSDKAIERAIALDSQHGISNRFKSTLLNFDSKLKASERAQGIDSRYKVSEKAGAGWTGINSYFEKALGTPTGQRVRGFYMEGSKQVMDVHNEARRLANLKAGKPDPTDIQHDESIPASERMGMEQVTGTERTHCNCGGAEGVCPCEPGKCMCASCPKNHDQKTPADVQGGQTAGTTSPATEQSATGAEPSSATSKS